MISKTDSTTKYDSRNCSPIQNSILFILLINCRFWHVALLLRVAFNIFPWLQNSSANCFEKKNRFLVQLDHILWEGTWEWLFSNTHFIIRQDLETARESITNYCILGTLSCMCRVTISLKQRCGYPINGAWGVCV